MDVLFICRDDRADSLVGNLLYAIEAHRAGTEVGVMFSGEALLALRSESFTWPGRFWPQQVRWSLADRAEEAGLPVTGRKQSRALEVMGIVDRASQQGVRLFACPIWGTLLKAETPFPVEIQELTIEEALGLLAEAEQVIGSL